MISGPVIRSPDAASHVKYSKNIVLRRIRQELQGDFSDRMDEAQFAGMQTDAAVFIGTRKAIFQVSLDGATDGSQLCPDLVMPPGMQFDFQQVIRFRMPLPAGRSAMPPYFRAFPHRQG